MDTEEHDDQLPGTVLQHLPHLTFLFLHDVDAHMLTSNSLEHASCLTNLQELHIYCYGVIHPEVRLSPSATPGLSRLTALQHVNLSGISLDPTILQDCTQLQCLRLQCLAVISAGSAAALHSLVGHLQQLQCLQLVSLEYDQPVAAAAAAAYTSLTASSLLQKLHLTVDNNMPAGIWPHVFPSDRQLPALRELSLRWSGGFVNVSVPPPAATPGTADLSCISTCCPGLCKLGISVQPGTDLGQLASGLTSLSVSGMHGEGFESLRALSGLVSLRKLSVELGGPLTPQDLMCLTALTGLTSLFIDPLLPFDGDHDVTLDLAQGRGLGGRLGAPVWLQVLQHCGRFSECQPLILNSVIQQLLEQQHRHTQQEQQLAAQQQQIAELQEQLATTRAQAAAEATAASAQVQGRLQTVEGQVQQLLQAMQRKEM